MGDRRDFRVRSASRFRYDSPSNGNNFRVVREPVNQRDGARRIGKDGVPRFERQIRRHHDRFLLIAATDDLKEQVSGVGVGGEIPDFVNGEDGRAGVRAEAAFEGPGRFLGGEIEDEIGRGPQSAPSGRPGRPRGEDFSRASFSPVLAPRQKSRSRAGSRSRASRRVRPWADGSVSASPSPSPPSAGSGRGGRLSAGVPPGGGRGPRVRPGLPFRVGRPDSSASGSRGR